MPGIKYIAAGYVADAEKLLTEFVNEHSTEFKVFTHFWKKHNFAAVFLGRSSTELQQFTHEIFQLTLKFLVTTDLYHQIGGVFMLYALFRNQVVEPPTRIRIVLQQYQYFLELRKLSTQQNYKALHYILGYLFENAFDLVAHPTLVGPRNSRHRMELEKHALQMNCLLKDIKEHSLPLFEDNSLREIQELTKAYSELTKNIPFKNNMFQEAADLNMEPHMKNLAKLIRAERSDSEVNSQSEREYSSIGSRRAKIKSEAFASKAWFRQLNPSDEEDDDEDIKKMTRSRAQRKSLSRKSKLTKVSAHNEESDPDDIDEPAEKEPKIRRRRRPRIPKERRRMGRPRKAQALEQLLMEDVEMPETNEWKGIKKRGPVQRTSYLDRYIEQPFKEPNAEMTMLSSTSEDEIYDPEVVEKVEDNDIDVDEVLVF